VLESWRPSRRAFLIGTGAGGILLRSLGLTPDLGWGTPPALADEPLGFMPSGLGGGGGINCIAVDPLGSRLVAGGDNSGPKVSIDGGSTWSPRMNGLPSTGAAFVGVAVEWDPVVPDRVWLATQRRNTADAGGVFVSADAGATWSLATGAPKFDAMDSSSRPRAVGRLIRLSGDGAAVYLGGSDSVWRYEGFDAAGLGGTPTQIVQLIGAAITSIALDPTDVTRVFVSTRTGCWAVTGADLAGTLGAAATPFTGTNAPARTEELVAVDQDGIPVVYAACWTDGLRRFDASQAPDGTWDVITPTTASTNWCSLDAVREATATTLVVGNDLAELDEVGGFDPVTGSSSHSIFMSITASDPIPTWISVCSGVPGEGQLVNESGGPGGPAWWGYLSASQGGVSDNRLGASGFVPEQIRISPSDPLKVFAVGTQGAFLFDRSASTWYPATSGLGTTANTAIRCDPNVAGRVVVTSIDHVSFVSVDGMVTVRKNENPVAGLPNNAFAVAFDKATVPSRVYLAAGEDTSNHKGAILYQADPASFGNWVSLGRPAGVDKRPLGVAVRRIAGKVWVLAAVDGAGVYRRQFSSASPPAPIRNWARVSAAAVKAAQPTESVPMRWEHDKMAYLFDHATGIWASRNGGATWQIIWKVKDRAQLEGHIAADPSDTTGGTLYVSVGAAGTRPGVWKLTACQTAKGTVENHTIHLTALNRPGALPFAEPGPIVAHTGGAVWVVENAEPNVYASADHGATWTPLGDDVLTAGAKRVSDMDVGTDGAIYVAMRGPGVLIRPAS
jgi:hypothetical protein